MNIEGKKVLVTGGAKRIGRQICKAFAKAGATIIIHYNSSEKEAKSLLKDLVQTGNHSIIKADLACREELVSMYEVLSEVDILVNNASVFKNNSLLNEDINTAKRGFDINFWAPFELMCELKKRRQKESVIINILDYRINKYALTDGSYSISKKALEALTVLSALQWAPKFRVNGIAPGFVYPPEGLEFSKMEKSLRKVPSAKPVPTEEICSTCLYLVKTDSITGEIIYLDGGAHI